MIYYVRYKQFELEIFCCSWGASTCVKPILFHFVKFYSDIKSKHLGTVTFSQIILHLITCSLTAHMPWITRLDGPIVSALIRMKSPVSCF